LTVKSCLYFKFDGINSTDYGILNVNVSTGMLEESFLSSREIKEIETRNNEKPYFQMLKRNPLILNLSFAFEDTWDTNKIRQVARWLNTDYYKELYFPETEQIFYCILIDEPSIIHNGLKQGYLNLNFRCDSPYSYSPIYLSEVYDTGIRQIAETGTTTTNIKLTSHGLSTGDYIVNFTRSDAKRQITVVDINNITVTSITGQTSNDIIYKYPSINTFNFQFVNKGDILCYPELTIDKIGNSKLSIINLSDGGKEFTFNSGEKASGVLNFLGTVKDGEKVTIGDDVYEFDTDNVLSNSINIKTDISTFCVASKGTLILSVIPSNNDTITIDSITYTFQTTLTNYAYNVLIGANTSETIDNLILAITASTGVGVKYGTGTIAHTKVTTTKVNDTNLYIIAKTPGTIGNLISTTSMLTDTNSKFNSTTLGTTTLGTDCLYANAIDQLYTAINTSKTENITITKNTNKLLVEYNIIGAIGNIITLNTINNAYWSTNTLTGGIDELQNDESIYINCERQEIISDLDNINRYNIFNDNYLELPYGVNNLRIEGNCKLQLRYQFRTLQG